MIIQDEIIGRDALSGWTIQDSWKRVELELTNSRHTIPVRQNRQIMWLAR
jgi:hypothetical protein